MKNQGKKPYQKNRSRTDNRNKSNSNKFKENKKQVPNRDNLKVLQKKDKIEFRENQNLMTREYLNLKKWVKMDHLQKKKAL